MLCLHSLSFCLGYHPIHTNLSISLGKSSVLVNTSFNITCSAQANPPAYYRFYKDQDNFYNDTKRSDISLITTSVSKRINEVNYSCTPFNEFGDGPRAGLTLTVLCEYIPFFAIAFLTNYYNLGAI